jgi:hypothetical protein
MIPMWAHLTACSISASWMIRLALTAAQMLGVTYIEDYQRGLSSGLDGADKMSVSQK